jgi:hypothetical protein
MCKDAVEPTSKLEAKEAYIPALGLSLVVEVAGFNVAGPRTVDCTIYFRLPGHETVQHQ